MTPDPNLQVDPRTLERTRQHINRLIEEAARLAESQIPPNEFYSELLQRVLQAMAAPAGVVWLRTPQGNLQLQFHVNLREVGIDRNEASRRSHDEMLRKIMEQKQPLHAMPRSGEGATADGRPAAGNPTDFLLLLAPILVNNEVGGILEVWQSPERPLNAVPGFLTFMSTMADLAARYIRNQTMGQLVGQQQVWTQLETFARQVHASLTPVEVAYQVANEGRRLVECDRVSVAIRHGRKAKIEAISGADVIETRSNLVVLMRKLADAVFEWNEKLVYTGVKDESLPPRVLEQLDAYLAESNSKLLVLQPLRDEREKESKKPARAALIMECFETSAEPQQLVSRLDVVARHATSALYNAVEHHRIPMRFLWLPLARLQEGLGGKTKAIAASVTLGVVLLILALWLVPYPLKMDATGQLLPQTRRYIYSPEEGRVEFIEVKPGEIVAEDRGTIRMFSKDLQLKIIQLKAEIKSANDKLNTLNAQFSDASPADRGRINIQKDEQINLRTLKFEELNDLIERTNSVEGQPGLFYVKAPRFTEQEKSNWRNWRRPVPGESPDRELLGPQWTVLNSDFRELLFNRTVQPSDPLLRLGDKEGRWEIELKIPQQHIGQVLQAFSNEKTEVLDVDLLLRSDPTRTFRGKLRRERIGGEATPHHSDTNNEPEPVVLAYVAIDGEGINPAEALPRDLLVTGTEVRAKIRCGNHRLGYSLFYGVWEFFYEKVLFYF